MATQIDSIDIVGLRRVHFEQLYTVLKEHSTSGYYYGNKDQYYKRTEELLEWLDTINSLLTNSDIKIKQKEKQK